MAETKKVEETEVKATKKVEEPVVKVEKKVSIRIPRERDDAEDKVVWVNQKRYLIKRGIVVEVPESVAAQLEHEERMMQYIYEYESKVQK